ncbi:hypothetical protein C8T65DRAFT_749574 [Cerioporus squamosus]|nr:hypothetical protein C8T65DRAFT_749574 [Cerioporus squamosus]
MCLAAKQTASDSSTQDVSLRAKPFLPLPLPPELSRMIVSSLDTASIILWCRGVHPTLSEIVTREIRCRHTEFLRNVVSDVGALINIMRDCEAIMTGASALAFLLDITAPGTYTFTVPYQHQTEFIDFFLNDCSFELTRDRVTSEYRAYCDTSARWPFAGVERFLYLRHPPRASRASPGNGILVVVAVTGWKEAPGNASVPVAFQHSTLQFNYLTADGILCAYPTLTLHRRSLFHIHRLNNCTVPLSNYTRVGIDFRVRADNWDLDNSGNVRGCARSWLAPCVRRRFGDSGCLIISFNGAPLQSQGVSWVWGGVAPCPIHPEAETQVHGPECTCYT